MHSVFEGNVSDDDVREYAEKWAGAKNLSEDYLGLVDVRQMQARELSSPAIRDLAARFTAAQRGASRTAIVASPTVGYGLARMYQAEREGSGQEIQVFDEIEAALAWLGVDEIPG